MPATIGKPGPTAERPAAQDHLAALLLGAADSVGHSFDRSLVDQRTDECLWVEGRAYADLLVGGDQFLLDGVENRRVDE